MNGIIAEHDAIIREVGLLRHLVKKLTTTQEEEDFGGGGAGGLDDDAARRFARLYRMSQRRSRRKMRSGGQVWYDFFYAPKHIEWK